MAVHRGKGIGIGLAFLLAFGGVSSSARAQFDDGSAAGHNLGGPNWYTLAERVTEKLETVDLNQLARSLAKAGPTHDPARLEERLNVFVRAGDRKQAESVIQALGHTAFAQNASQPGIAADFLIAHGEWDPARHLLDVCPLATPSSKDLFVAHFEGSPTFPDLDRWLASREHLNPAFWSPTYLEYRRATGTLGPLLDERAADLRAHPHDIARLDSYLSAADRSERRPNIAWLPTTCRFSLAIENLEAGARMNSWPDISVAYLERALQLPITFDDYLWLEVQNGTAPADFRNEPTPEAIRLHIRTLLMARYQALQQTEKAQTLEKEIAAVSPKPPPWHFNPSMRAPEIGHDSQTLEPPVPAAEPEDKSDYRFWLTRAQDYLAKKARDKAEQAFQQALALTRAQPGENDGDRISVLRAYVDFRYDEAHPMPTIQWLRSELDKTPIAGDYAREIIGVLIAIVPRNSTDSRFTQEALWRCLAARKRWGWQEVRFLELTLNTVQGADREAAWTRAEKAAGSDPDREMSLGTLMQRMQEPARAAPVLEDSARQSKRIADHRNAVVAEFDDAVTKHDWPRAKAVWPEMRRGLDRQSVVNNAELLLEVAVNAGAYDDAMELYVLWSRYDHNLFHEAGNGSNNARYVTRWANLGLRDRLVRYYQAMAASDPESHVPQDILPALLNPPASVPKRGGPPGPGGRLLPPTS